MLCRLATRLQQGTRRDGVLACLRACIDRCYAEPGGNAGRKLCRPWCFRALAVLALVFGVGKLADVGGVLGRSIREFRRELREDQEEEHKEEAAKVEGKSEEERKS